MKKLLFMILFLLIPIDGFTMRSGIINSQGTLTPGEETVSNTTSITPNGNFTITYQANTQSTGTLTINNPTNTPVEGQGWELKISSTNSQTFSWGTSYEGTTALPLPVSSSGGGKTDLYVFQYNRVSGKLQFTGQATGF